MGIKKDVFVLGATAAALTTVAVTGAGMHYSKSQAFFRQSPKELVDEVWQVINHQYVDATFNGQDWQAVRNEYLERGYETEEESYEAIREMLDKLGDPYTRFMDPEQFKNMQIDTSGELTGVGIQISKEEDNDYITVVSPIEDTPAYEAGLIARDVIIAIDGVTTEGMELEEAVKLIRGKPGTQVTLTIKRKEEQIDFTITRARIQLHPVVAKIEPSKVGDIGYIRLKQFSSQAAYEMREAIKDLESKKVNGYILDLRSNPGGLLYSSIEIARMWIDEGVIVSTVNRVGTEDVESARNNSLTDKPLVVLVDGGSASASEILSGALQDHDRAVLIGTQTFGKGLVQSVRELGNGAGLAVTIAKYLTPDGWDINKEGITPDIIYELSEEERESLQKDRTQIGTIQDPQFAKALEILSQEIKTALGAS